MEVIMDCHYGSNLVRFLVFLARAFSSSCGSFMGLNKTKGKSLVFSAARLDLPWPLDDYVMVYGYEASFVVAVIDHGTNSNRPASSQYGCGLCRAIAS